jgi:hypothetical protein
MSADYPGPLFIDRSDHMRQAAQEIIYLKALSQTPASSSVPSS